MTLVGHSMGGYIASMYTIQYPRSVSSLKLLAPAKSGNYDYPSLYLGKWIIVYILYFLYIYFFFNYFI